MYRNRQHLSSAYTNIKFLKKCTYLCQCHWQCQPIISMNQFDFFVNESFEMKYKILYKQFGCSFQPTNYYYDCSFQLSLLFGRLTLGYFFCCSWKYIVRFFFLSFPFHSILVVDLKLLNFNFIEHFSYGAGRCE